VELARRAEQARPEPACIIDRCQPVTTRGGALAPEHEAFLAHNRKVFLLVRSEDGTAVAYPMTGAWIDGALEFSTYRKSVKVRRIARDDRVCCVVTPWDWRDGGRVLLVWGHCQIRGGSGHRWDSSRMDAVAPAPIDVPPQIRANVAARTADGKRVTLRVEPIAAVFV